MLDIRVDDIPEGSKKFRVFDGEYAKSSFILSGLIEPDGKGGCEITNVQGDMTPESNVLLGLEVIKLGYKYLTFKALKGTKVTRYAVKEKSDEYFDYYRVTLNDK